jgi:glycine oxidase
MRVAIIGAGVAGLVTATLLAERGVSVEVFDRGDRLGSAACSWLAGGMLAPWCEGESAEPIVTDLGQAALTWWPSHHAGTETLGTLVVAPPRDTADLSRFARRTAEFEWLEAEAIASLEPDLAGRFRKALFFPKEAHLDPRAALADLAARLRGLDVPIHFGVETAPDRLDADRVVDCRGFAASADLPDLRGVKGEMLLIRTREITLRRPVRMLHPRIPLYVVPRQDGLFMVGATSIESRERTRITARSMIELLSGAYALHPAFGEAEVVEIGTDVRPAFPDNIPAVRRSGRVIYLNGLYRHGFLLSPAFARQAVDALMRPDQEEGSDAGHA